MSNTAKKHGLTITIENASHDIYWYQDDNGNVFFNATAIWKAAGSPANRRPYDYLRSEDGQTYIVEQYRTLTTNTSPGRIPFDPDTWVFTKGKQLPDEVLSHFVETTRGYNGGTFMMQLVALDYAQWVSVQVKDEILRTYRAFGSVNRAIEEGRTEDAVRQLDKVATKAVEKQLESEGVQATPANANKRLKSIRTRHEFTAAVQDALGDLRYPKELSVTIGMLTNVVYTTIWGESAKPCENGLQIKGRSDLRNCLSEYALRAVEYAEDTLVSRIKKGQLDVRDEHACKLALSKYSDLLRDMANQLGDSPLLMENTNVRGGDVNAKGTFQGLLPAGASKVGFVAKQLASEQG